MGCGAVCGNSSTVAQNSKQAELIFKQLFALITPNQFLFPLRAFAGFAKDMQLTPHRFQLILTDRLEAKSSVSTPVMEKWKIILFGLDFDCPSYVNCLGYPKNALKAAPHQNAQDQKTLQQNPYRPMDDSYEILPHSCFSQIEKDLDRTFVLPVLQRTTFSNILKRISNHFPVTGYTQGINFIVGYLLIIGYSEFDSFWMFIHIALNRRYMLLGLFEDGFPLSSVYTIIFRNMLKRNNPQLYTHLYENIMIDDSLWVFKWFTTYYIYSFPIQMCQYVWDTVLSIGGIGLITFAVSIVCTLSKQLLLCEDVCQVSQLLETLKKIETFNQNVSIREVVKKTYAIKLQQSDMEGLQNLKNIDGSSNIYAQYFLASFYEEEKNKKNEDGAKSEPNKKRDKIEQMMDETHQNTFSLTSPAFLNRKNSQKSKDILEKWYNTLSKERIHFYKKNLKKKVTDHLNLNQLNEAQAYNEKQGKISRQQIILGNSSQLKNQKEYRSSIQQIPGFMGNNNDQLDNIVTVRTDKIMSPTANKKMNPQISSSHFSIKKGRKESNGMWDEDEQREIEEQDDKMGMDDQFYYQPKNIHLKKKYLSNHEKAIDILSQYSGKSNKDGIHEMANSKFSSKCGDSDGGSYKGSLKNGNSQQNRFVRAGQNVLSNMSVSNASGRSSASSRKQTHKQNYSGAGAGRYCGCPTKNRTEQHKDLNCFVRKKTVKIDKNIQHYQQSLQDLPRKRVNTENDWMANSQGPKIPTSAQLPPRQQHSQMGSEVEIINGQQLFKKKSKGNRIGGGVGVVSSNIYNISEQEISECASRKGPIQFMGMEEESLDSMFIGNISSQKSSVCEGVEVQSVK